MLARETFLFLLSSAPVLHVLCRSCGELYPSACLLAEARRREGPAFCVHNRSKNFTKKKQDASETVSLASCTDCLPRIFYMIEDGLSGAVQQVPCVVPVICVNRRNPKVQSAPGVEQHTWVSSFRCPLLE